MSLIDDTMKHVDKEVLARRRTRLVRNTVRELHAKEEPKQSSFETLNPICQTVMAPDTSLLTTVLVINTIATIIGGGDG